MNPDETNRVNWFSDVAPELEEFTVGKAIE